MNKCDKCKQPVVAPNPYGVTTCVRCAKVRNAMLALQYHADLAECQCASKYPIGGCLKCDLLRVILELGGNVPEFVSEYQQEPAQCRSWSQHLGTVDVVFEDGHVITKPIGSVLRGLTRMLANGTVVRPCDYKLHISDVVFQELKLHEHDEYNRWKRMLKSIIR